MRFGRIPLSTAEGAILAHATTAGDRRFRKAHVLTADDVAVLEAAGVAEVVGVLLDADDLDENAAATAIAKAMSFRNVEAKPAATGRVNLYAEAAGIFTVDAAIIDAVNAIDPAVTLATLAQHAAVDAGQMVATVKIIPFAAPRKTIEAVAAVLAGGETFAVHPFRAQRVGLIQTELPTVKGSVLDKTARVTEARLSRSGSRLTDELRTPHDADAVARAVTALKSDNDMILVFGASAMSDFDDIIPSAIRRAGGDVIRAGMPVDPGNLIVLGEVAGKPVIGAPGCARSPKENGFDWVLDRLIAGLDVSSRDIAGMGVGGLLMEITARPQPREAQEPRRPGAKVHAVVLAAGRSSRMGGPNKLMALFDGKPLVRRTVEQALASKAAGTVVVTGHQTERIRSALSGISVKTVENHDYAEGLSTSLKAGVAALPADSAGALIVLGDMPAISAADLDRLIVAFIGSGARAIIRATFNGKRGNPVLLPRSLYDAVAALKGDTGARHLVEGGGVNVIDVEIGEGAAVDVDTPEALQSAGGVLQG